MSQVRKKRRHGPRRRRLGRVPVVALLAAFITVALVGAAFAGYRYDKGRSGQILPGIRIAGVDVGGMNRAEARRALAGVSSRILGRRIVVRAGNRAWPVTPKDLGARLNVERAIDRAISFADSFGWASRAYHMLLDKPVQKKFKLKVSYDSGAVASFVRGIAGKVDRPAQDATREFRDGELLVEHSRRGWSLDRGAATKAVMRALRHSGTARVRLEGSSIEPETTEEDFGKLIVVRLSQNRLYLFDGLRLEKRYSVATGQPKYPTPQGDFQIINKRVNPTWINPATDGWGKEEPDLIPPGPDNPLGTRALDLNAPGIRIHGTYAGSSIGTHASHGCVRMHIPDSEDLFGRVDIGTPVIITQ